MKTFTLTLEQVKDIFRAGCQQGADEHSSYDWGSSRSTYTRAEALEEALVDVLQPVDASWEDRSALYHMLSQLDLKC